MSDVLGFTSNATHMQQVCNKDIDMYRTFFGRDTGECPFFLNLINRIYKLLYIKVAAVVLVSKAYEMENIQRGCGTGIFR